LIFHPSSRKKCDFRFLSLTLTLPFPAGEIGESGERVGREWGVGREMKSVPKREMKRNVRVKI
jgi:hypothetical protein